MIALQYWLYFCHISTRIAMCVLLAQSCPTLCDPVDCSRPGSSVRGILQARMLEQIVISSSRGSSPPRDQTHSSCVSCICRQFFTASTTREAHSSSKPNLFLQQLKSVTKLYFFVCFNFVFMYCSKRILLCVSEQNRGCFGAILYPLLHVQLLFYGLYVFSWESIYIT